MYSENTRCRICKSENLTIVLDLGMHALSSRFPDLTEENPPKTPLILEKCLKCELIQLKHNVSQNDLYSHVYGYRSGINTTMRNHLKTITNEVEKYVNFYPEDIVVDIGSNDSTLLKLYEAKNIIKVGIDPTGIQFKEYYDSDTVLIPKFFTAYNFSSEFPEKKAKVVTSIAMFYDLPDPVEFMKNVKHILSPDGIWIMEQSYMPEMLRKNSFDTICQEHLEYYAFKQIQYMADMACLKILDVSFNECNGGSFRIILTHQECNKYAVNLNNIDIAVKGELLDITSSIADFSRRCELEKTKLMKFLVLQKSIGKTIYIYGASTKGNVLLQYYGITVDLIPFAVERNPEKFGRRTPGTNIPIISEEKMRENPPDFLLVLPWHFKEEFLEREKAFLETGGKYIFPLPEFEVVG